MLVKKMNEKQKEEHEAKCKVTEKEIETLMNDIEVQHLFGGNLIITKLGATATIRAQDPHLLTVGIEYLRKKGFKVKTSTQNGISHAVLEKP